jgi:hypothetical protein
MSKDKHERMQDEISAQGAEFGDEVVISPATGKKYRKLVANADVTITAMTDEDDIDIFSSMSLNGVTISKGLLLVAPSVKGSVKTIKTVTFTPAGSLIGILAENHDD